MNSNFGKSSFDFDLGIGSTRSRSLNDQKNKSESYSYTSSSTFSYSQPILPPTTSPPPPPHWKPNMPSWTHQQAPPSQTAVAAGIRSELGGPTSMVGDILGKSWNSMGSSGLIGGGIGIVKKDPNLFGDLVSSALGQGKGNTDAPLKSTAAAAASASAKGSFFMGGLADSIPKSSKSNSSNSLGSSWANSEQFGSFVSAQGNNGGFSSSTSSRMNKSSSLGGPSMRSSGGGGLSSSKDPFSSLVDFGSKPLAGAKIKSPSKSGGSKGSEDFDFGDFQNAPISSTPNVSSSTFPSSINKPTSSSSSSAAAPKMDSVSTQSQVPVQPVDADSLDMFFSPSSVSTGAGNAGTKGGPVSIPFSDGDDWGLEVEFGGGAPDVGGTTELEGLPPPPAGVSPSTAKNKGLDNQKQGQYADAIKWLSWAVVLLERAGDIPGTMDVLVSRALCYKEVGEYKKAVADCTKVLDQDGANVSVLVQRALLYESMEKYKLGAEDLRTVMKLDPGNRVARSTIHRLIKLAG
ncbi:hypothetical protein Dimus_001697 [Dionaea muscipula]